MRNLIGRAEASPTLVVLVKNSVRACVQTVTKAPPRRPRRPKAPLLRPRRRNARAENSILATQLASARPTMPWLNHCSLLPHGSAYDVITVTLYMLPLYAHSHLYFIIRSCDCQTTPSCCYSYCVPPTAGSWRHPQCRGVQHSTGSLPPAE